MTAPHAIDWHHSASQLDSWDDCQRKWAWRQIAKVKDAGNKYALAGKQVHAGIEGWLRDGRPPDPSTEIGKIIAPMHPHLPRPREAIIEREFSIDTVHGPIMGFMDALLAPAEGRPRPKVFDWKSTSDLRYAKKADVLDAQRVTYSVAALELYPEAEAVDLLWLYVERKVDEQGNALAPKRPRVKPIELRLDLAALDKPWQNLLEKLETLKAARASGRQPLDYNYNADTCDKYGGCPYKTLCNLSPAERLRSHMAAASLKDRMKVRTTPTAETAPAPPPPSPGSPQALALAGAGSAINPPESQLPPPASAAPPAQMSILQRMGLGKKAPAPAPAPAPAQAAAAAPTAPAPAPALAPAPAAAPVPSSLAARVAKPSPSTQQATLAEATPPTSAKGPPPAASSPAAQASPFCSEGFALFIDCGPVKTKGGALVSFQALAQPVLDAVAAEVGGGHFTFAEYGKGPGLFALRLDEYLTANPLPRNVAVTCSLASPEARAAIEVLTKHAGLVVRGF